MKLDEFPKGARVDIKKTTQDWFLYPSNMKTRTKSGQRNGCSRCQQGL